MQTEPGRGARPLGVVIDARCIRAGASGVGHYVAGLLRGLDSIIREADPPVRVTALRLSREADAFHELWASLQSVRVLDVDADYEAHPAGDWFLNAGIGEIMRRTRSRVLVSPYFITPVGPRSFARVVGVLDDLPWSEPENYPAKFRAYIKAQAMLSLPFAERAFTLSKTTARALKRHLRPMVRGRLERVPGAVDSALFAPASSAEKLAMRRELGISSPLPLAVFVGSHERRKNHSMLVRALRPLAGRLQLALIGKSTEAQRRALRAIGGDLRITFAHPASHAQVATWARAADLALFPSLNEGFGLPPLEALAAGVPLIASNIGAVREVVGRHARLIPPEDTEAWTSAVGHTLDHPPAEAWLAEGVARARGYTWNASAAELLRLVREAAGTQPARPLTTPRA